MFRPFRRVVGFAAAAFLASVAPASAGTIYDLNATSLFPVVFSNFTIRFDDASADGLLQIEEINSFTGVTVSGDSFSSVACVPNITAFATGNCSTWEFRTGGSTVFAGADAWSYARTNPVSAVPVPSALLLFASGLGLVSLLRWWRTSAFVKGLREIIVCTKSQGFELSVELGEARQDQTSTRPRLLASRYRRCCSPAPKAARALIG